MIRESRVDPNLNRLSAVFGAQLVIRPPASADDVAGIEHLVGPLPLEYAIFLMTCNGLHVRTDAMTDVVDWHLWHTQEIVASVLDPQGLGAPPCLLPFCGDPTAMRDCFVMGRGPAEGAIVRWDPWAQGVELLASCFGRYLDRWTDYMIARFASGEHGSTRGAAAFDATYIGADDPRLETLRDQDAVAEWLRDVDCAVASGDDFE